MSNGMPSMTALLGMLALAGYQNRDKLSELLKGATSSGTQSGPGGQASPLGGLLGNIGGMLGGGGAGGFLTEVWGNCLKGLSRTDMAMRLNPGSMLAQTRKFRLHSLSRQSVPTFLQHWKSRPAFRKKSY
jgi:hypothetical protein